MPARLTEVPRRLLTLVQQLQRPLAAEHKPQMAVLVVEVTGSQLPQDQESRGRETLVVMACHLFAAPKFANGNPCVAATSPDEAATRSVVALPPEEPPLEQDVRRVRVTTTGPRRRKDMRVTVTEKTLSVVARLRGLKCRDTAAQKLHQILKAGLQGIRLWVSVVFLKNTESMKCTANTSCTMRPLVGCEVETI